MDQDPAVLAAVFAGALGLFRVAQIIAPNPEEGEAMSAGEYVIGVIAIVLAFTSLYVLYVVVRMLAGEFLSNPLA